MRLALAAAGVVLLMSLPTGTGVGGLTVSGAGVGTTYAQDGSLFCREHPFTVNALFAPGGRGALLFQYEPGSACPLSNGGAVFLGTVTLSPFGFQGACSGTEATGLTCAGISAQGDAIYASIGPYAGPGASILARYDSANRDFEGLFIAT